MKSSILLALVATALPAFAGSGKAPAPVAPPPVEEASSISYDFVEAGWVHTFDSASVFVLDGSGLSSDSIDTDGYRVALSKTITGGLYGFGSLSQTFGSTSLRGVDFEVEDLGATFGLGYAISVASNVDFIVQAGAGYSEYDLSISYRGDSVSGSNDQWGAVGATGFRIALTNWLELNLFYTPSYFDSEYANAGKANLIFRNIISSVDLVLSGWINENNESVGAGLRYNF